MPLTPGLDAGRRPAAPGVAARNGGLGGRPAAPLTVARRSHVDSSGAGPRASGARPRLAAQQPRPTAAARAASPSALPTLSKDDSKAYARHPPSRKTKVVCTIGPTSNDRETFFRLAHAGMNVVRLNMSHGDHESHRRVIELVREYNALGRSTLAIMLDTKGPEVRSGDVARPLKLAAGDPVTFTIAPGSDGSGNVVGVNYDGFIQDVEVGDTLLVDGGIMSMRVVAKTRTEVRAEVVDGGALSSRRHLNVRGRSANLPAITERDWADIRFGVAEGVDYIALSFVRDARVVRELKRWLRDQGATGTASIGVLPKIESADSVSHLEAILDASDGAMVARGDLGAELDVQDVPYWQSRIVDGCRRRGKPVIVATNMLESMIASPAPTRAEVSDIATAVREGTDAVMLSGETAHGAFPLKSLATMARVAHRAELSALAYHAAGAKAARAGPWAGLDRPAPLSPRRATGPFPPREAAPAGGAGAPPSWEALGAPLSTHRGSGDAASSVEAGRSGSAGASTAASTPGRSLKTPGISEMFAYHAVTMADTLRTSLIVFSRKGNMPALLSHYRPDYPVYCFTENEEVLRRMALLRGITAIRMPFSARASVTFDRAILELKRRGLVHAGQLLGIVQSGRQPIWRSASTHSIALRAVPLDPVSSSDDDGADLQTSSETSDDDPLDDATDGLSFAR